MTDNTLKSSALLKRGEYRIIRVLGQGGFGITYEAEQVNLGRKVAVKEFFMKEICNRDEVTSHVSVPSVGSKELVEKFKDKFIKEARMLAGYRHPSIVKVYDVFEDNGTAYYVMEYLEGGSLHGLVKSRGKLGETEALAYIKETADALGYIHSRNTLHLDVKPGNIMLDSDGRIFLIDFGISKHIDGDGHLTSSTPLGISKGYASFEQVAQESDSSYSPATDIYSLGATLYFLLTGKPPYDASALLKGLPTGELEEAGVSRKTIDAISAAMKVQKDERPQSVDEFLKLLDNPAGTVDTDDSDDTVEVEVSDDKNEKTDSSDKDDTGDDEETVVSGPDAKKSESSKGKSPAEVSKPFPKWLIGVIAGIVLVAALAPVLIYYRIREEKYVVTGSHYGHEYVDLGLSVKWATCNVGASSPEDHGSYFAWGETEPKSEYSFENLKYCTKGSDRYNVKFSKYVASSQYGTVDNKTILVLSDDAARKNWGGSWHMPTIDDFQELIDKCTWTWTTLNGENGYKVTSKKNGNFIFLPAAGWRDDTSPVNAGSDGAYWSSSLVESRSHNARYLDFNSEDHYRYACSRSCGLSVRPVFR